MKAFVLVAAVFFIAGTVCLYWSSSLPVYRDEAKYDSTYQGIGDLLQENKINNDHASDLFYKNQDDNMTDKYALESTGWFFVITGVYCLLGFCATLLIKRTKKTLHVAWLYALALINTFAYVALGVISLLIDSDRGLFPYWADSLGIPLFSIAIAMFFILPLVAGIAIVTTLKYRRQPYYQLRAFSTLPVAYKLYFIAIILLFVWASFLSVPYPTYDLAPLLVGGLLFNFLLYGGVQRAAPKTPLTPGPNKAQMSKL